MDYSKYNVEDFAADESFVNWVNNADPEAERFWSIFLLTHPELAHTIEQARILILNLDRAEDTRNDLQQIESIWKSIAERVETPYIGNGKPAVERKVSRSLSISRIALPLAAIIIVSVTWLFRGVFDRPATRNVYLLAHTGFMEQVNESGSPVDITLSDGSVVTLENKSRIKYKENYSKEQLREVYLLGAAFFNVAKDPAKPFIVHTHEVNTEVLGTSFRIQASENDKHVVVSVKTGKVSVYAASDSSASNNRNGVILLPNQEVSYERMENSFNKKLVESPVVVSIEAKVDDFTFDNTPIRDVFKTLERAYGIEILFNEEVMKNCYLTAPLGSEPLFEKLKIICQTIGGNYEVIDTKIVINGPGC